MFHSPAGREWRSRSPVSHRAHPGCLEEQVSYHGDALREQSDISVVRAHSGRLLLCYCSFDSYSLIFTPGLSTRLRKLKLRDHELLSLAGSNRADEHTELATCEIKGYIPVQSNVGDKPGVGKEALGPSSGLLKIIGETFLVLHLWAWFCSVSLF